MRGASWVILGWVVVAAGCGARRGGGDDDGVHADDAAARDAPGDGIPATDAPALPPIPADCFAAAERGLSWLVGQQNADGSWGAAPLYKIPATGLAVLKLETYAEEIGISAFNPGFVYVDHVRRGLDYLFAHAFRSATSDQTLGPVHLNGNGNALAFSGNLYDHSIALMAVVAGAEPLQVVHAPGIDGWTYREIVQDAVEYIAFAQSDPPVDAVSCRGGWRYQPFNNQGLPGDNSVSQWVTLALEYARHPKYRYLVSPPAWLLTELREWVGCIQDRTGGASDGASGYAAWQQLPDSYKTGALIQQFALLGDAATDPQVLAALGFLRRTWDDTGFAGWKRSSVSYYLAMYSIMKGMESMAITDLDGIDWYREFCDRLKAEQRLDGSWPASDNDHETVGPSGLFSTLWALLVLERAAPPPPIVN